jgi:hypothetical protein
MIETQYDKKMAFDNSNIVTFAALIMEKNTLATEKVKTKVIIL